MTVLSSKFFGNGTCLLSSYTLFFLICRSKNSKFVDAMKELESSSVCQSLNMHSFLMLPMQRITRLPLLVEAIHNRLASGKADAREHEACKEALETLNKVLITSKKYGIVGKLMSDDHRCCHHRNLPQHPPVMRR